MTLDPTLGGLIEDGPHGFLESIPGIFYVAEIGADGKWLFVSPQIESILGYTAEEWLADPMNWANSLHPEDRDVAMAFEDERLIDLDEPLPARYRLRKKDGGYLWVADRARMVESPGGRAVWRGLLVDASIGPGTPPEAGEDADQWKLLAKLGSMAAEGQEPEVLLAEAVSGISRVTKVVETSIWGPPGSEAAQPLHRAGRGERSGVFSFGADTSPDQKLNRGEPVLVYSWSDPAVEQYAGNLATEVRSSVFAPMIGSQGLLGTIVVHSDKVSAFGENDASFVQAVASLLSSSIERSLSDQYLKHRLNNDPLTNLPNKEMFRSLLAEAIVRAEEKERMVGVLFIGINHLKLINDGIGHGVGDELLRTIGARLAASMRWQDTVARYGDEEFAIILNEIRSDEEVQAISGRIVDQVTGPIEIAGANHFVTARLGASTVAPSEDSRRSAEDLIREADAAMHQARESTSGEVEFFGQPIKERLGRWVRLERDLHTALEESQFRLVYQPIVDVASGELASFEGLVRWDHPEDGLLDPAQFTGAAEESGMIEEIDNWVLNEATRQSGEWLRELGDTVPIAVNTSCAFFSRPELPGEVSDLLTQNGLHPGMLSMEMTESVLLEPTFHVLKNMSEMRNLGIQMVLDDFGTGFSSLSYLSEFAFDVIKVDRSFVARLDEGGERTRSVVDAILTIGKSLSLEVVAEGVSNSSQMNIVRDMGFQMAQGFLFSRPLTPDVAATLIQRDEPLI